MRIDPLKEAIPEEEEEGDEEKVSNGIASGIHETSDSLVPVFTVTTAVTINNDTAGARRETSMNNVANTGFSSEKERRIADRYVEKWRTYVVSILPPGLQIPHKQFRSRQLAPLFHSRSNVLLLTRLSHVCS